MDKLEKILREDHAPQVDINARKRAVNLAMAEFKSAQNEKNQKNSQGISFFSRLMGKSTQLEGERSMETKTRKSNKKLWQGTAMVTVAMALFAVPVLLESMSETIDAGGAGAGAPAAGLQSVSFGTIGGAPAKQQTSSNNFGSIAANTNTSVSPLPSLGSLFSGSKKEDQGSITISRAELADEDTRSAPQSAPPPQEAKSDDPLKQWRQLQEYRLERQLKSPENGGSVDDLAKKQKILDKWRSLGSDSAAQSPPVMAEADRAESAEPLNQWVRPPQDVVTMREQNRDQFEKFVPNPFKQVSAEPVSTFSSDVDTASYSFVRKTINNGHLPSPNAVRVEEMINYFTYSYANADSKSQPFKPTVTITDSPWAEGRKLMHIGIKGYELDKASLRSNLVFLLDVSGSMNSSDKLPLVKSSMKMLLDSLHPDDTVSIVTYAGSTGVALQPTKARNSSTIINAMNNLRAGGGTAGAAGIELAYQMAEKNFSENAVNRVILATDGDFNVGITDRNELKRYVERKREKGIFLSVLGFGQGNYNDHMMQTLAQNGNGVAAYIDTLSEARKVLVEEASSALFPIAKDVKFQVEFNPAAVAEYRLIGYETRALKREDFNNDKIDAGDIGAGHTVTAIYEFVPVGSNARTIDPLRYGAQEERAVVPTEPANEYAFLKIRYKLPMENTSTLITAPVSVNSEASMKPIECGPTQDCIQSVSNDTRFATAVAAFGQMLKGGEHTGNFTYDDVIALAQSGKGEDKFGYRAEFINLVRMAKSLSR